MDPAILEYQVSLFAFSVVLIAWYTEEVGFVLLWYFLKTLEVLVAVLQMLARRPFPSGYVDVWGSPFACPSLFLTEVAYLAALAAVYYTMWRAGRPPIKVALYFLLFGAIAVAWAVRTKPDLVSVACSIALAVAFALVTYAALETLVLPHWHALAPCCETQAGWAILLGRRNTLLPVKRSAYLPGV